MQYFINLNWALSPTLCTLIKIHPLYKMLLWNTLSRLNINHRDAADLITALDASLQRSDVIFMAHINTRLQVQPGRLWTPLTWSAQFFLEGSSPIISLMTVLLATDRSLHDCQQADQLNKSLDHTHTYTHTPLFFLRFYLHSYPHPTNPPTPVLSRFQATQL